MKKLISVSVRRVLPSFGLVFASLPVLAQQREEAATQAPESGAWLAMLLAIFFLIAIAIGCFKTPKRTHLDAE